MKNRVAEFLFFIFLLLTAYVHGKDYSIIYVHLGTSLPPYLFDSITQSRRFNPKAKIFLICYREHIKTLKNAGLTSQVHCIVSQSLIPSQRHVQYNRKNKSTGFWKFTSERFFYLEEVIRKYKLENVFHLESDNLLYVNLEEYLQIFEQNYQGIAATFDNDQRCIPGFIYIKNYISISHLAEFFSLSIAQGNITDMEVIGKFRNQHPQFIDNLPIIPDNYQQYFQLKCSNGTKSFFNERYYRNFNIFNSIFDAAAIGQYLGGIDPIHANSKPGFINESCLFNPSNFEYTWKIDEQGRKMPFILFKGKSYRINNLHIHCKDLKKFIS